MKPNPVKKTVEYCSSGTGFCSCYERNNEHGYGHCKKYNRDLTQPYYMDEYRPSWCTDETFVRVKIEPAMTNEKEYCVYTSKYCHLLELSWNHDTKHHFCPITGEFFSGSRMVVERPEVCRKLEVE